MTLWQWKAIKAALLSPEGMGGKQWLVKNLPLLSMISMQLLYSSMHLAVKATMNMGYNPFIFFIYRQASASLLLAPVSFMALRRKRRSGAAQLAMGKKGFFLVFIAVLIGATMNMNLFYKGMELSSATLGGAMNNIIPAVTFIMAAAVGMEKVKFGSIRSMAKVVGTVISVSGAFVLAFFKGHKLLNSTEFTSILLTSFLQAAGDRNWLLGFWFLLANSCCWSIWLILQVPICKKYLDPLSLSTWMSVLSTFQAATIALVIEPNWRAWRIDSGLALLLCLYSGFGVAISYFVQSWCVSIRGPVFSAMFSPLITVFTTIGASIILQEELYIGSLAGAVAIIIGLYIVLWGKAGDIYVGKKESEAEVNFTEPLISSSIEEC